VKVCTKAHVSASFGAVPKGALFEDDHEVVTESPDAFKPVKSSAPSDADAEGGD
jgi:hypothetical protein